MRGWKHVSLVFSAVVVFVLAGMGLWGCGGNTDASEEEPGEIRTVEAARGTLATTVGAFGRISMPCQVNVTFGVAGKIGDIAVEFGDRVSEGDVLAGLETETLERAVQRAEADLRTAEIKLEQAEGSPRLISAEAAVEAARAALVTARQALEDAREFTVSDAEAAVRDAEVALENARRSLAAAEKDAEVDIRSAKEAVEAAEDVYSEFVVDNAENLAIASYAEQRDDLLADVEAALKNLTVVELTAASSIATAENNVAIADEALENARDALNDLQLNPASIQELEAAVRTKEASLAQAEADLAYVKADLDLELLRIAVDKARIALEDAEAALNDAAIVAPFDGTIVQVNGKVGDTIAANTVVLKLVDTNVLEVDAEVDEIDAVNVRPGQEAVITVDALPNARLTGEVIAISPVAQIVSGLVTYELTVSIENPDDTGLKDGMTASADIDAVLAEDVVLLPKGAIKQAGSAKVVAVVTAGGETEPRVVETGASDGSFTEIVSGVEAGEVIAVNVTIDASQLVGTDPGVPSGVPEDIAECIASLQEERKCFERLAGMAESMGMDPGAYSGEIDWDQLERFANDNSGMMPEDIKECMKRLVEKRQCIEKLMAMAEDMGMDPGGFSLDDWGNMGGFGGERE